MTRPGSPASPTAPGASAWLFVPGTRPDRFDKAADSGADEVIIDLEDAVAPTDKEAARAHCVDWLRAGGSAWVRINGSDTPWHADDLAALAPGAAGSAGADLPGLRGLVVPTADRAALDTVDALLADSPLPVIALVETARGVLDAADLAQRRRVVGLAFGSLDYAVDLGVAEDSAALDFARSALVVAARAAGLPGPVDGVTADVSDASVTRADAAAARRLGMAAKLCIHPRQVAPVQAAFAPSESDVQWARALLDRVHDRTSGVVEVDGRMVDRPVILRAEQILARAADSTARHHSRGAS